MTVKLAIQGMTDDGIQVLVEIVAANADELDADLVSAQEQIEKLRERLAVENRLTDRRVEAMSSLSVREREVAELIAQGKSNREIARELTIGLNTVESHAKKIYSKLGVHNRMQMRNKLGRLPR